MTPGLVAPEPFLMLATVGRPAVMANPLLVDGRGLSFTHLRLE
jgi:hypothetical protein